MRNRLTWLRVPLLSAALASLPTAIRESMPTFCGQSWMAFRTEAAGIDAYVGVLPDKIKLRALGFTK